MFCSLVPDKCAAPPLINFQKILTRKWLKHNVNGEISCQIMILYLDFVIGNYFLRPKRSIPPCRPCFTPQWGLLPEIISDPLSPVYEDPRLLRTQDWVNKYFPSWLNSNYYSRDANTRVFFKKGMWSPKNW